MNWTQLKIVVDAKELRTLSDHLEHFDVQAITTENAGDDEFYEVAFPGTPSWDKVRVTALFNDSVNVEVIAASCINLIGKPGGQEVPYSIEQLKDQNWERVWLQAFKPVEVGHNLWVVPSWCEPSDPSARNIRLDPGLAFGTGTHATTFMCLNWLADQQLKHQRVLDYGSGSGILAIAAIMSGADHADAVDIDPFAVSACVDNAKRNEYLGKPVSESMSAYLPKQLEAAKGSYQLVIANILTEVILELSDELSGYVAPQGQLLLTGILDSQADKVVAHYDDLFNFTRQHKEHWVLLIGRRRTEPNLS